MAEAVVKLGDGNWATKEGKLLAHKQVGDKYLNTEFDVTRGTDATYVGKDGLIKQMSEASTELVTDGEFPNDDNWTVPSGWTVADGVATCSADNPSLTQDVSAIALKVYKVTFDITSYTSGILSIDIGGATAQTTNTAGSKVFYFTAANTNDLRFYGGSFRGSIDNVSVKKITDVVGDIPRIDFLNNPQGHLLLEPVRANQLLHSNVFTQWSNNSGNVTLSQDSKVSPWGTATSTLASTGTNDGNSRVWVGSLSIDHDPVASYTGSVFVSKNTMLEQEFLLGIRTTAGALVARRGFAVDSNGVFTIGSTNSGTVAGATVEDYGNGWYRLSMTWLADSTEANARFEISPDGNTAHSTETSTYIAGAQFEAGTYPTSYIPTNGVAVTRATELCDGAGTAKDIDSVSGVLYMEIAALGPFSLSDSGTGGGRYISLNSGNSTDSIYLGYSHTDRIYIDTIGAAEDTLGALYSDVLTGTDLTDFHKVALRYKDDDWKLYVDGSPASGNASDTSAGPFGAGEFTTLSCTLGSVSHEFYGKVKSLRVYKEALSDAELALITS